MTTWGAYLNTQDLLGRADAIAGAAASAADDGVLMQQGLKNASKCRECSKTLDVGTAAYFNKEGEPGRKITCKECHDAKAPPDGDEAAAPVTEKKRPAKKRRVVARLTPEVLVEAKGIAMVYKAFPKVSFKGRGHEVDDLRKLLNKCARRTRHPAGAHTPAGASTRRPLTAARARLRYAEWAHTLVPEMDFNDVVEKLEKVGGAPFGDSRRHSSAIRRNSSARRRLPHFSDASPPPSPRAGGRQRARAQQAQLHPQRAAGVVRHRGH